MKCLKSVLGMEKVNLIKRSSKLYKFIDKVCIEIREIHTDSYYIHMDMNKDIVTLPKKGLKTKPYNIGMEKRA